MAEDEGSNTRLGNEEAGMRRRRRRRPTWAGRSALGMALLMSCGAAPHSVNYTKVRMLGTPAHVVTVNLNDPEVRVSVAMARSSTGCETFRSVLRRTRPAAAITGTYFATDSFWPVGDIVV